MRKALKALRKLLIQNEYQKKMKKNKENGYQYLMVKTWRAGILKLQGSR